MNKNTEDGACHDRARKVGAAKGGNGEDFDHDESYQVWRGAPQERAAVPEGLVLMPKALTAENGAKSVLVGEFKETLRLGCPDCDPDGESCDTCGDAGEVAHEVTISWDTIKRIYALAVERLAAPAPAVAQEDERQAGRDLNNTPCPKCGRRIGVHTQVDWEECFGVKTPPDEEEEGEQVAPDDGMFSSDWKDGYSVGFQAAKKLSSPAAASSESVDTPELRRLLYALSCTTGAENKEIERRVIAHIESLIAARVAGAQAAPSDVLVTARDAINGLLRQFTGTPSSLKDSTARAQGHAAIKEIDAAMGAQAAPDAVRDAALAFADHIINGMFEGGDWRGENVQELAIKYGLLKQQTMEKPCGEDGACQCAQNVPFFPAVCYRKTYMDALKRAASTPADDSQPAVGAGGQL